jgi:predicted aldo/keto reductase-like oxidoreductase
MPLSISRRELMLAAASFPAAAGAASTPWNQPAPLGGSGLRVTRLGVGLEDTREPKLIARAVELGVNHFNYFPPAGAIQTFSGLGEALRPFRDRVVLGSCPYRGSKGRTPAEMEEDLDAQLRELRLDCIDLWYMTSAQKPEDISDGLLNFMIRARKSGKIRAGAVSTHCFAAIAGRLVEAKGAIDAVLVVCNFATWVKSPVIDMLRASMPGGGRDAIIGVHDAGIGTVAMKPLMGGLVSVPPDHKGWAKSLTSEESRTAALTAALKWVLANRHIDTVPVRITGIAQLEHNVKAASEVLSTSEAQLLADAVDRASPFYCRMCQRCEGACRKGLPVSDILRFLMYADGYGNPSEARRHFRQLPHNLQAITCRDCAACTVVCPNGVRVRERLTRAQTILSASAAPLSA